MKLNRILSILLLAALTCTAACGSDDDPVQPSGGEQIDPTPDPEPDPTPDPDPDPTPDPDSDAPEGYVKIWADEFEGDTLNEAYWNVETIIGANQELQYYADRTENLRVKDGCLEIEARKESMGGREYTSARINTKGKIQVKYGYVEARMWLPAGRGTWPAFWMLGTASVWPTCGEIDIMEHVGSDPTMVSHALHTAEKNGDKGTNWSAKAYPEGGAEENWHTYAILWEEDADAGDDTITFFVDGVQTAKQYQPHGIEDVLRWPFNSYFYVIFNLALGGSMGGTVDDTIFDGSIVMKVDYVRIYQKQ